MMVLSISYCSERLDIRVCAWDSMAGFIDTSATTMEWLIYILIEHKPVLKKLHDIMDKMCKKITIKMPLNEVKENTIKNLQHLFVTNSGSHNLRFVIYDVEEKLELDVPSRTTKIKISNEFLAELDKQHINYKLN